MTGPPPFQELLDRHSGDVLGFLIAAVGPQDAEDCFQETFLSALRAYPRLKDEGNLRAWLMTIAHRKAIDHHRRGQRGPTPLAGTPEPIAEGSDPVADGLDPAASPRGGVWTAVAALPPKQRTAVALRFACDMPHREIGAALDCSEAAARRNVHEGVKRLREVLV
ncbi:MAG: sigma-70 family RNA polymerase sigma factor [Solirubrobacterales bacterium]